MKKSTVTIIILSSVIAILIALFFTWWFISRGIDNRQVKENKISLEKINEQLIIREQRIKELIDNPVIITKEKLIIMTEPEKDKTILDLQDKNIKLAEIIKQDTFIIESLKNDLQKTTDILAKSFHPKHSLSVFGLAGIDRSLDIDIYAGLIYRRYFFDGRFYIGGGFAIKAYKELGGSVLFEIGFACGIKKPG